MSGHISVHQIGANRKSQLLKQGNNYIEIEVCDVRELMSRTHCLLNGERVYHVAIIDYLQTWNFNKKCERFMKTVLLGKNPDNLSAIEPA